MNRFLFSFLLKFTFNFDGRNRILNQNSTEMNKYVISSNDVKKLGVISHFELVPSFSFLAFADKYIHIKELFSEIVDSIFHF